MLAKMDSFLEAMKASHEEIMAQIGSLVFRMDANQAKIKTNNDELMALMKASQENIKGHGGGISKKDGGQDKGLLGTCENRN
jgi:hypothetical protein